jgi:hypothetical protein
VIFADVVAIWVNVTLSTLRSILNPVSLFDLSIHERLISRHPAAVADRFEGAAGVELGEGVPVGVALGLAVAVAVAVAVGVGGLVGVGEGLGAGVGVDVALGVGVGVGVGVRVAVGVGVGGAVAVGVELALGVGVGLEAVALIWRIFATEGTPFEFRIKSM